MSSKLTVPPHIRLTYSGVIHPGSIEQERTSDSINSRRRSTIPYKNLYQHSSSTDSNAYIAPLTPMSRSIFFLLMRSLRTIPDNHYTLTTSPTYRFYCLFQIQVCDEFIDTHLIRLYQESGIATCFDCELILTFFNGYIPV